MHYVINEIDSVVGNPKSDRGGNYPKRLNHGYWLRGGNCHYQRAGSHSQPAGNDKVKPRAENQILAGVSLGLRLSSCRGGPGEIKK